MDGDLILDGPIVVLHGSTIAGLGGISVETPSTLDSRLNAGQSLVRTSIALAGVYLRTRSHQRKLALGDCCS